MYHGNNKAEAILIFISHGLSLLCKIIELNYSLSRRKNDIYKNKPREIKINIAPAPYYSRGTSVCVYIYIYIYIYINN